MYAVSDEFLQAVQENTRTYYWTGRITTTAGKVYTFDYTDIVKGSGYVTSKCCSGTEIELGTVYAAEMGVTLYSSIDRYTLEDATVELFFHLILADGTEETVPMGIFEVAEANRTSSCLEITAYDYMLKFEEDFTSTDSTGTAWGFIALCCTACGVECAHTQEIEKKLLELQQELLKKANNQEDYHTIADEIFRLRELQAQSQKESQHRDEQLSRIAELMDFLREQPLELTTFDEVLVRRLLQKISVYDDHFTIEFKSGVSIDINE